MHAPSILHQDPTTSRTPSPTAIVDLETNTLPLSLLHITTTSNGGSYLPAAPISPPWSHMSIASSSSSGTPSTTSSYNQSVSICGSSTPSRDVETCTSNSESVVSGPFGLSHSVFDCSGHPPRRCSMSTNSSRNANARVATDDYFNGADPPAYSSRPGSLYQEPMKYEAGLPLAGSSAL